MLTVTFVTGEKDVEADGTDVNRTLSLPSKQTPWARAAARRYNAHTPASPAIVLLCFASVLNTPSAAPFQNPFTRGSIIRLVGQFCKIKLRH